MIYKDTKKLIEDLKMVNERNNNFLKKEIDTFTFCFLIIGYLEKNIQGTLYETILDSQKPELKYPELIDLLLKEKTFGQKIEIFEFATKKSKSWENIKDFIIFCKNINYGIRNSLFHFKINELRYKNLDVSKLETQNKIMTDLLSAEIKLRKHIKKDILKKSRI